MTPALRLAAAIAAALASPSLHATTELSPVRVEAGKTSLPALTVATPAAARAEIQRTPGGVDVIEAESYKTGRAATLADTLAFSPGVYIQSRFGAEEARLSIRGSGIQRTFHLRGIQLLQDGVPLNQADGGGDFQAIEPLALSHIEVYRGANALRFGASTLGGAVNFVTPSGYDAPAFQARATVGSFGHNQQMVAAAGTGGAWDGFASLTRFAQDGFRRHAKQEAWRFFANAGLAIDTGVETRFYFAHADSDSELPGALTRAQLRADPRQNDLRNPVLNVVAKDNKRDIRLTRLANRTVWQPHDDTRIEASGFVAKKALFHPLNFAVIEQDNLDYGGELRIRRGRAGGDTFTAGLLLHRNETDDRRHANNAGKSGALTDRNDQTVNTVALYGEYSLQATPTLALIAGAQVLRTTRVQDDRFPANGANNSDRDKTYRGASPKLGALWQAAPDIQVFANVSGSFEPPSFSELTGGAAASPVFARAQRALTLEAGSRGRLRGALWDVALYHARIDGELLALFDPASGTTSTINSPGDTVHQGVEAGLTLDFGALRMRNSYQFNDFRFVSGALDGRRLGGIPRHVLRAELHYRQGDFYAGPSVEAASGWFIDHRNTVRAPGYATLGFKVGSRPKSGLAWYVEGRNLADRRYAATTGVVFDAGGMDQAQFLPGDGRSVYAGLEWRL